MLQNIKQKTISKDEAFRLTEKLISKSTPDYIIRDALIERGMSAFAANEIISEMRSAYLYRVDAPPAISGIRIALIMIAISLALIFFFLMVNSVS